MNNPIINPSILYLKEDCCRKVKVSEGGNGGLITYGALDTVNCEANIDYVSLSSKSYWQFPIDGSVRLGRRNNLGKLLSTFFFSIERLHLIDESTRVILH